MFDKRSRSTSLSAVRWCVCLCSLVVLLSSPLSACADNAERAELINLAARVIPQARIDFVMFDKIDTTLITPKDPSATLPMVVGRIEQQRWTQSPDAIFQVRDFLAPKIRTVYFKSNEQILSPRYNNRRCKDTWSYTEEPFSAQQKEGERQSVCSENAPNGGGKVQSDPSKAPLSSPPDIETASLIGTYRANLPGSSGFYTETIESNVKSRTQLSFNGPPGKMFSVDVKLSLENGVFNEVTRSLHFTPIACKGIKVGTATTDKNCIARVRIPPSRDPTLPNMQTIDVTPSSTSGKIIRYEISIASGPQEK